MVARQDICFGPYQLDREARRLTRDGKAVALQGRALAVLGALAAAGGDVIGKHDLLRDAWPSLTVDENNLHQQISALRKALGDGVVATVPGRGYRLALAAPAVAGGNTRDHPVVGVLPLASLGGDPELRAFADGQGSDIAAALSRLGSLVVVTAPGAGDRPGAARLGLRYVVEGAVRRAGGRMRVAVRLVDPVSGVLLWAEHFDGDAEDAFALQDRVSARVAAGVPPRLVVAEIKRVQRFSSHISRPYDLLLRGLAQSAASTRAGMEEAIRLLRRAITLDPGYALAHAHLASIQWLMVAQQWQTVDDPFVADLLVNGQSALALAGDDPEILLLVSPLLATRANDLDGAIDTVYRSLAAHPHNAAALRMLGVLHAHAGDVDVAFDRLARADQLNPFDHGVTNNLGYLIGQFCAGDHESVARTSARLLTVQPRFHPILRWRAASLGLLGRIDEGRAVMRRIVELSPGFSLGSARKFNEYDQSNLMRLPHVQSAYYEGLRLTGATEG